VLVAAALLATVLGLAAPGRAAATQFTPVAATVDSVPQPVRMTDGRVHLVYEISLLSLAPRLDVQSLAVRAQSGGTLLRINGARITTVMTNTANEPTRSLGPGEGGRLWLDVALRRGSPAPRALVHHLSVRAFPPAPAQPLTFTFDGARTRVSRRHAIALAPPLRGRRCVNINGCCGLSPHRTGINPIDGRLFLSQRFAIDFLPIDRQGRAFVGDIARNESFLGFRDPVYAVADARVVSARNNLRENTPPVEPLPETLTPATALGNNVVLRLRDGRFALYAHLHTGSVRVHRGQRVHLGQLLGRVGNTGESGAPHLHFHVSDGPEPLASDGLPYVFDRFTLTGTVTNLDQFLTGTTSAVVRSLRPASARRRQLPLQSTVLDFPPRPARRSHRGG
jgi:Peptidase family M23